jgi:hypothetical protein
VIVVGSFPTTAGVIGAQVAQRSQHPPVISRVGREAELGEDARDVTLHRRDRHDQLLGDEPVRPSLRDELQNFELSRRQLVEWIMWLLARGETTYHHRIDRGPAVGDPAYGGREILRVADPGLEQVSEAARAINHSFENLTVVCRLGEDQNGQARLDRAELARGLHARNSVPAGRHVQVHYRDLRVMGAGLPG